MAVMPNLIDDRVTFQRLQDLQECLCAELAAAGGPDLCYCGLWIGDNPPAGLMSCSDKACGVAWVRPLGIEGIGGADGAEDITSCNSATATLFEIGVLRCYPRPEGRNPITPQQMFDATRLYMSDARAMKRAALCCLPGRNPDYSVSLQTWQPADTGGGISGGIWVGRIE